MIAYINEPETTETMSDKDIIFVLDNHSIDYKYENGVLLMCDEYSKDGEFFVEWIEPKRKYGEFMGHLGY